MAAIEAGDSCRLANQFYGDDTRIGGLAYHLMRLTVVGRAREERADLLEFARFNVGGRDSRAQAGKIKP